MSQLQIHNATLSPPSGLSVLDLSGECSDPLRGSPAPGLTWSAAELSPESCLIALRRDALEMCIRDSGLLLAGALALLIFAPHVAWVLIESPDFNQSVASRFGTADDAGYLARVSAGLLSVGEGLVNFMLPLGLVIPVLAWRARSLPADDGSQVALRRYFRLLSVLLLALTAAIVLLVIASGTTMVRKHYLFIFLPFPLWVVL